MDKAVPCSKSICRWLMLLFCSGFLPTGFLFSEDPLQQAISQLGNSDPQIRRQAAEALGRLRNPSSKDSLIKLIEDPVATVRIAAIDSLGLMRIQAAGMEIAKHLESDPDPSVRHISAIALGYISETKTVPVLIKGIKDPHEGTRFACVNSLGILKDGSAVDPLAKELKNMDGRMRNSCAYALGNIADKKAVPFLLDALKVSRTTDTPGGNVQLLDAAVGSNIIRSLGMIGDISVLPQLKTYLEDKDNKVKIHTAQALHRLGDKTGLPIARKLIKDTEAPVRKISIELLAELGDTQDMEMLKKIKTDPDVSVQQALTAALQKLSRGKELKKTGAATKPKPAISSGGTKSPVKPKPKGVPAR